MNDTLGDRMKMYEGVESDRRFMPLLPVVARMDGRGFSKFTKGMKRPYDVDMSACMIKTAKYLVQETGASMGYTQSDEISLVWHSADPRSQIYFDGRVAKMTSQLAAHATLFFYNQVLSELGPKYAGKMPTFDARVWSVPTRMEAVNALLWREQDAMKNSVSMAASHYFSHGALQCMNGMQKRAMLLEKDVDWDDYPPFFKYGTYIQRRKEVVKFTREELESLPPKHAARTNPDLHVERTVVDWLHLGQLANVSNKAEVVFDGAKPIYKEV